MDGSATLFSVIKRSKPLRAPTKRVWRRQFLREWRNHRGLSEERLAERSGVSTGQISLIENGKSAGSPKTLEKLAEALQCEVGELLDIKPRAGGRLLRTWVDESDRARIEAILKALSGTKPQ